MSAPTLTHRRLVAPPPPPPSRAPITIGMVLVVALLGSVFAVGAVMVGSTTFPAPSVPCDPGLLNPTTAPQGLAGLRPEQAQTAQTIIATGRRLAVPAQGMVVALATAMQESGLRNLDHGLADSVGAFQQRPSMGWGTPAQLRDVGYAAEQFYRRLLAIPDWAGLPVTRAAQAVQRSALPDAYAKWQGLAAGLVTALAQVTDVSGCAGKAPDPGSGAPDGIAGKAIAWARQQLGKPYQWGGTGPGSFDCSGLMMRAFAAAGITLPRTSAAQFGAGAQVARAQAQQGDLLFWANNPANPATIHHVAVYLGGNQILEAPTTGVPVRVRTLRPTETGLMPVAVRPATPVAASAP